jgi:hypothetical protein
MKPEELIEKYNEGLADPAEVMELEKLIEEGIVSLTQLRELYTLDERLSAVDEGSPSLRLDDGFYAMLAKERNKQRGPAFAWPSWSFLMPRLAVATVILFAGFAGGYWLRSPSSNGEVAILTQEVVELKEMMMFSLLEKESASDRLRAVSLSQELVAASDKVTDALFTTLNNDPNVNVRLAALEALMPYASQASVREGLVRAISAQDSPLVQVSLAELMVALQEKKSVTELQKLADSDRTPKEVKEKIRKSIEVLI